MVQSSEETSWLLIKIMDMAQSNTFSSVCRECFDDARDALGPATLAAMFSPSPDNVCSIAYVAVAQAMKEPA